MDTTDPRLRADFMTLNPAQACRYERIRDTIMNLMRYTGDSTMTRAFILNALVQTGDNALAEIQLWAEVLAGSSLDSRDIAGIVHERPLEIPYLVAPDLC